MFFVATLISYIDSVHGMKLLFKHKIETAVTANARLEDTHGSAEKQQEARQGEG